MGGVFKTGDLAPELLNGIGVLRVIDLIGPFVRVLGGVVELLFFGPVTGVASEFVADADVGQVRLGLMTR